MVPPFLGRRGTYPVAEKGSFFHVQRRNVMGSYESTLVQREERIKKVLNLEEPDRVPFAPKIGNYYALSLIHI